MTSSDERDKEQRIDESAMLQHYELLKSIGVFDQIEALKSDARFQRGIVEEAIDVFRTQEIEGLINHLISRVLDKFIPSYLVFILRRQSLSAEIDVITYRNMNRVDNQISILSLSPFADFFARYDQPVAYSLFEHETEHEEILTELARIAPELLVPIASPGGLMGLIIIGKKIIDDEYTNQEIEYLNRLMQFGSVAFQNIIHYMSASRDAKTELYNHSFFMNKLDEEIQRYNRYGREFSVLVCDLDHFKLVNDTYGHLAGDAILFEFARILESTTRNVDIVARYGGEEFVALLVEADRTSAWRAGERIRTAVDEHEFIYDGQLIRVSCSIGGCHAAASERHTADDLIQNADTALYWAKANGRNRTAIHKPGLYFKGKYYYSNGRKAAGSNGE